MENLVVQKTPDLSRAEQTHIIMPMDLNGGDSLFGGRLMAWIDEVAGVTARRHSETVVRTAAVEHLDFLQAAYVNDIITLIGRVVYVGRTSMEVCVDSYVERMNAPGNRLHVNRALLIMVAIDANGKPCEVPKLLISTDEEKQLWNEAANRAAQRKAQKNK